MAHDPTLSRRESSSRDLWVRNQIAFLQGQSAPATAAAVSGPTTTEEVAAAVRDAAANGLKIVPLGAGSGVCGGISASGEELIVDLKGLTNVDVRPDEGIARFGAGVMGRHAEEACNRVGYTIGHFPSSIACSTVGGWVAARGAGQLSSRYGKIEDMCVGATAVLADGSVHRALRGSQALAEWVGNEGTLAVITEVELRIRPLREGWTFAGFMAPSLQTALDAAKQFVRQRPVPSLIRVYDPIDSRIALSHSKGGLAKRLPLMLAMPRVILHGGNLALRKCLVVVGWEGAGSAWTAAQAVARAIAAAMGLQDLGEDPGRLWLARRHDVSFKQISILRSRHFADTLEVACPWTRVVPVYNAVRAAISPDAVSMAHFSHAYSDGSAIYFSMAGKLEAYDKTWERALQAASDAGATVSHHHGVGRLKAPLLVQEFGGAHRVLVDAKRELDPQGLLNPGCLGLPCEPQSAPAHVGFEGLDVGNGLWRGEPAARLGDIEKDARRKGWTLGVSVACKQSVAAVVSNDLCWPASTAMGSARDLVRGVEGTFADGQPFGTRVAPRAATGPDLRHRLLDSDAKISAMTLRMTRWPQKWRHLHGEFNAPLGVVRAMLVSGHEPWATAVRGRRLDIWFAADTPPMIALAASVAWDAQEDTAAPDHGEDVDRLVGGTWRPWAELRPGVVLGMGLAGGWQVEVQQ